MKWNKIRKGGVRWKIEIEFEMKEAVTVTARLDNSNKAQKSLAWQK